MAAPAAAGDRGCSGGVPNWGGLLPNDPFNAAARADFPGPGKDVESSAPGSGDMTAPLEGAGDARRAIDVALEGESARGALPRMASEEADTATGRGSEADELSHRPDISPTSPSTSSPKLP
ncbi:MAG: hypothetical protein M1830_006758 [Pleopsidium flavum]|nr:MAG: hypothetical protein M1830_006758 [Pleopsidium flavum]